MAQRSHDTARAGDGDAASMTSSYACAERTGKAAFALTKPRLRIILVAQGVAFFNARDSRDVGITLFEHGLRYDF